MLVFAGICTAGILSFKTAWEFHAKAQSREEWRKKEEFLEPQKYYGMEMHKGFLAVQLCVSLSLWFYLPNSNKKVQECDATKLNSSTCAKYKRNNRQVDHIFYVTGSYC
jgi:hypothetical protein